MAINFHESDTDRIECKITIRAEIEVSGRGRRDYESDSTECWFSIPFVAILKNGIKQVRIGYASEYSRGLFRAEDSLTKFFELQKKQSVWQISSLKCPDYQGGDKMTVPE